MRLLFGRYGKYGVLCHWALLSQSKSLGNCYFLAYTIITPKIYISSKVGDHSRGWPEGSLFDSLLHQCVGEGATPFPRLLHFTLDPYLIMLSVKQGGIKYHFFSLWYESTWDRTQVSRAIGEHSNRQANVRYQIYIYNVYIYIFFSLVQWEKK